MRPAITRRMATMLPVFFQLISFRTRSKPTAKRMMVPVGAEIKEVTDSMMVFTPQLRKAPYRPLAPTIRPSTTAIRVGEVMKSLRIALGLVLPVRSIL